MSILCHWVSFWVPSLARSRTNSGGHCGGRRPPRQRCFLKAEAILKATTVVATTAHCQRPRSRTILSALCASAEDRIGTGISSVARICMPNDLGFIWEVDDLDDCVMNLESCFCKVWLAFIFQLAIVNIWFRYVCLPDVLMSNPVFFFCSNHESLFCSFLWLNWIYQ